MTPELVDGTPPGCLVVGQEKGWMNSEVFLRYFRHFQAHTKCSQDRKVLLLVYGHASHKSHEAIEFCRKNGIVEVCFPPHCTSLDVAVFGPLMSY